MRIYEILSWNNDPIARDRAYPLLNSPPVPFGDDMINLANAFTRDGLVKHFWNFQGSEGQTPGPAPPVGTELIPSGTLEPTTASWEAEPVETKPQVGLHRPVPFRQ
jgi:hypothetical protein